MKRNILLQLATAVCLCASAVSAYAHHSHGLFFDPCKSLTLEGWVEGVQWKDPHIWIELKSDDGTLYRIDWTSLRTLTTQNSLDSAKAALKIGATIVVTANAMRDPAAIREQFAAFKDDPNVKVVDPSQIHRKDDSWNWATTTPVCNSQ